MRIKRNVGTTGKLKISVTSSFLHECSMYIQDEYIGIRAGKRYYTALNIMSSNGSQENHLTCVK